LFLFRNAFASLRCLCVIQEQKPACEESASHLASWSVQRLMILSDDRFRPAPPVEELASRKVELENGKFVKDVPESTCRAAGAQLRVSDEPDLSAQQGRRVN